MLVGAPKQENYNPNLVILKKELRQIISQKQNTAYSLCLSFIMTEKKNGK